MTQKIKLMSDEEILAEENRLLAGDYYNLFQQGAKWAIDNCEKRAFEKMREVAYEAWEAGGDNSSGFEWGTGTVKSFDNWFQQFSKEQQNQEAITLLKEWKERDGSEIEENYNKLIKEQENGE